MKAEARDIMTRAVPKIFLIGIVYILFSTVLSNLSVRLAGLDIAYGYLNEHLLLGERPALRLLFPHFSIIGAALLVVINFLMPILDVGFIGCCIKVSRAKKQISFGELFDGFNMFGKILLLSIIRGIFVTLWSLLLIIPGIVAQLRYSQAYYILLDDPKKGIMQCLRESKELMRGNKMDFFILGLSFLGWIILGGLVAVFMPIQIPVVAIWLTPYSGITNAIFYNYLIKYPRPMAEFE